MYKVDLGKKQSTFWVPQGKKKERKRTCEHANSEIAPFSKHKASVLKLELDTMETTALSSSTSALD